MKFPLFATLGVCMLAAFTVNSSIAQQNGMTTLPDVTVTTTTNVSKKVADYFKANFKDAENVRWSKLNRDFLVTFITADINNRALFQKNGRLVYHLKYGREKHLPEDVRKLVKSQYDYVDYNITRAINVLEGNRNIWVVDLEDKKKYVIVRVEDGEIEEVSNLNKSVASN